MQQQSRGGGGGGGKIRSPQQPSPQHPSSQHTASSPQHPQLLHSGPASAQQIQQGQMFYNPTSHHSQHFFPHSPPSQQQQQRNNTSNQPNRGGNNNSSSGNGNNGPNNNNSSNSHHNNNHSNNNNNSDDLEEEEVYDPQHAHQHHQHPQHQMPPPHPMFFMSRYPHHNQLQNQPHNHNQPMPYMYHPQGPMGQPMVMGMQGPGGPQQQYNNGVVVPNGIIVPMQSPPQQQRGGNVNNNRMMMGKNFGTADINAQQSASNNNTPSGNQNNQNNNNNSNQNNNNNNKMPTSQPRNPQQQLQSPLNTQQLQQQQSGLTPTTDQSNNNTPNSKYKSELCKNYLTLGTCPYSSSCQFAHSEAELRVTAKPRKFRTQKCKNWSLLQSCPYAHRCCFLHLDADGNQDIAQKMFHLYQDQGKDGDHEEGQSGKGSNKNQGDNGYGNAGHHDNNSNTTNNNTTPNNNNNNNKDNNNNVTTPISRVSPTTAQAIVQKIAQQQQLQPHGNNNNNNNDQRNNDQRNINTNNKNLTHQQPPQQTSSSNHQLSSAIAPKSGAAPKFGSNNHNNGPNNQNNTQNGQNHGQNHGQNGQNGQNNTHNAPNSSYSKKRSSQTPTVDSSNPSSSQQPSALQLNAQPYIPHQSPYFGTEVTPLSTPQSVHNFLLTNPPSHPSHPSQENNVESPQLDPSYNPTLGSQSIPLVLNGYQNYSPPHHQQHPPQHQQQQLMLGSASSGSASGSVNNVHNNTHMTQKQKNLLDTFSTIASNQERQQEYISVMSNPLYHGYQHPLTPHMHGSVNIVTPQGSSSGINTGSVTAALSAQSGTSSNGAHLVATGSSGFEHGYTPPTGYLGPHQGMLPGGVGIFGDVALSLGAHSHHSASSQPQQFYQQQQSGQGQGNGVNNNANGEYVVPVPLPFRSGDIPLTFHNGDQINTPVGMTALYHHLHTDTAATTGTTTSPAFQHNLSGPLSTSLLPLPIPMGSNYGLVPPLDQHNPAQSLAGSSGSGGHAVHHGHTQSTGAQYQVGNIYDLQSTSALSSGSVYGPNATTPVLPSGAIAATSVSSFTPPPSIGGLFLSTPHSNHHAPTAAYHSPIPHDFFLLPNSTGGSGTGSGHHDGAISQQVAQKQLYQLQQQQQHLQHGHGNLQNMQNMNGGQSVIGTSAPQTNNNSTNNGTHTGSLDMLMLNMNLGGPPLSIHAGSIDGPSSPADNFGI